MTLKKADIEMKKADAIYLAGKHNATANNTVAIVCRTQHPAYAPDSQERDRDNWWDVEIKTLTDYRRDRTTGGDRGRSRDGRGDPGPGGRVR